MFDKLRTKRLTCKKCGKIKKMIFIGVTEQGREKYQCPACYFINEKEKKRKF